jgi:hypothetical protein
MPVQPATEHVEPAPTVLLDAPLTYEVVESGAPRTIHTPMVRGAIGDTETLLILDTGASDPVFTLSLARAVGIAVERAQDGSDHAHASVVTYVGKSPLRIRLAGYEYTVVAPLFIDGPPPFEGWGVGGFLSPQLLHARAWVAVDLRQNRLQVLDGSERSVVASASARAGQQRTSGPLPRTRGEGDDARLVIVEAAPDSGPSIRVLINTGALATEVATSVDGFGTSEAARPTGRGVSGATVLAVQSTRPFALTLGALRLPLDAPLVRMQTAAYDAQLGMSALSGSVLLVRAEAESNAYLFR